MEAFYFLNEFVLGNNPLGRVVKAHGTVSVIGGEDRSLAGDFLPGEHNPIFYGSGTSQYSTVWPSATIAAWNSFLATATRTAPATIIT
jgi:carboxypeptidase D